MPCSLCSSSPSRISEVVRQEDCEKPFVPFFDIRPIDMAGAFTGAFLADRQKTAEAPIGFAIRRIDQKRGAALQIEPASDDQTDARYLGRFMRAHHAGERIPIDNAERLDAQHGRRREQLFSARTRRAEMRNAS